MTTNSKWLDLLDLGKITPFPLQFANIERLNSNDAVYIFDEVGSGKTINSGLMALDYLEKNPKERVLVITTNALARPNIAKVRGQFLDDWFNKLPFTILGYENRIDVVNNHHSKFKRKKEYGLVVIDEAHLFLNKDTQRYQNLVHNISAKKVIFLSATPIKENDSDLGVYSQIAEALLKKKVDASWINQLKTSGKSPDQLICSQFDPKFPVTRYFKDTIKSLERSGHNDKRAKRQETLTWEYQSLADKDDVLVKNLRAIYAKSNDNRFVIFTRYVESEASRLGVKLESEGFIKSNEGIPDKLTYYIVTGVNGKALSAFSRKNNLPTVLILTYQIAEQGLNLPGYNHVVNYHIPAFPSALEQRYGRVDRLDSESKEIYNCFLLRSDTFDSKLYRLDTNSANFVRAIDTSLKSLVSYLPSKNTILTPDIYKNYVNLKKSFLDYITRITDLLQKDDLVNKLYDLLLVRDIQSDSFDLMALDGVDQEPSLFNDNEDLIDLFEFCEEISIDESFKDNPEEAKKALLKDIREALTEARQSFALGGEEQEKVIEMVLTRGIWDHVFYAKDHFVDVSQRNIGHLDAVSDCGKSIMKNSSYETYLAIFNEQVRLPVEFNKYRDAINGLFEKAFIDNDFYKLFPKRSYQETFQDEFGQEPKINSKIVLQNLDRLVPTLPFMQMVNSLRSGLKRFVITSQGGLRTNFAGDTHVFAKVMELIAMEDFGFQDESYLAQIFESPVESYQHLFKVETVEVIEKDGVKREVGEASNWLKLVYHLTEDKSIKCVLKHDGGNRFNLDRIIESDPSNYKASNGERVISLFSFLIDRNTGELRTWAENYLIDSIPRLKYARDYWTSGILQTVYNNLYGEDISSQDQDEVHSHP